MDKDPTILHLLDALPMQERGWVVVRPDPWEADLCAIAICRPEDPRHLVYVSTWQRAAGRFDFECEKPRRPDETDYEIAEEGEDISIDKLLAALNRHLVSAGD